jgi:cadmium resistance protein CadD (predicted permease)
VLVPWITVIGVGIVLFATTNIDDILLLSAFFADRTLRPRAVVIGQFAGIGVLTLASAVAALLALAIPDGWIALLGLAPLALGIRGLHDLWQSRDASDPDAEHLHAEARAERATHSQWIAVALVTIANGGDNLGVYIPLFSRGLAWVPVYAAVFAVMTALWCGAGYWFVHHPILGARIRKYGHMALPFVLIGLGLYILADARALIQ